jgi:hypothetical protein
MQHKYSRKLISKVGILMPAKGAKYTGTRIPANKLAGLGNIDQHTINVCGSGLEIRNRMSHP